MNNKKKYSDDPDSSVFPFSIFPSLIVILFLIFIFLLLFLIYIFLFLILVFLSLILVFLSLILVFPSASLVLFTLDERINERNCISFRCRVKYIYAVDRSLILSQLGC